MASAALSRPSEQLPTAASSPAEEVVLASVERYLGAGLALQRWWEVHGATGDFQSRFELERAFNRPSNAYGFFDEISTPTGTYPIMGVVQEMPYDHAPAYTGVSKGGVEATCRHLREFALKYFMRVSSFQEPAADAARTGAQDTIGGILGWCRNPGDVYGGFGYSQHFARRKADGQIVRFEGPEQFAIVDQRELARDFDWLLARVKIYDFGVRFKPFPPPSPELSFAVGEDSYLAISPEFVRDVENPAPGVLAEYGLGYAFVKNPIRGLLGYGPGAFEAAFKTIQFQVLQSGAIRVRLVFISNRPSGILKVRLDPVALAFRASDLLTFGLSSKLFGGVERALRSLPYPAPSLDPVYTYVSLLNTLTGGRSGRDWCVTRDQLDLDFLVQHFLVHYRTLAGSLVTWRMFPDWLNETRLPKWVVEGAGS
jgi:hypothetical protein